MIPVLFESTARAFSSCGIGELADAMSCTVTRGANGLCYLDMEYPVDGVRYSDLAVGRIIKAADHIGWDIFVIESIEYSLDGTVKIYAPTYACLRLVSAIRFSQNESYTWTKGDAATGDDIHDVMSALRTNVRPQLSTVTDEYGITIVPGMTFKGNISLPAGTSLTIDWGKGRPTAFEVVQAVADAFGGEIVFKTNQVLIGRNLGEDIGLEIRYGVNMTALDAETDGESYVSAVMPEGGEATDYLRAETPGVFPFYKIGISEDIASASDYLAEAQKLKTSIKVQFDPYGNASNVVVDSERLQLVGIYDIVTVVHPGIGLKQKTRIVKTVYNTLTEQYESLDVGEIMQDITDTIAALVRGK